MILPAVITPVAPAPRPAAGVPLLGHDDAPADTPGALAAWPGVRAALRARGTILGRLDDEDADAHENRLGTQLMALYRDSRTPESFEALYAFARPSVQRWIQGLLHRGLAHLDPAELLQDTFVNVYRYPGAFRDDHRGSFRVWVRTIAGNIVRRACARSQRLSFQELPEGLQEPQDRRASPLREALVGEESSDLRAAWVLFLLHYAEAWKDLRPRDRRTLQLVEVEGRSYAEVGDILGVGRSNMKMIVFRARKRIARRMRLAMSTLAWRRGAA